MSGLNGKWIQNQSIDGDKTLYKNEQYIKGRNAGDTADLNMAKVNSADQVEFGIEPVYHGTINTMNSLVTRQFVVDSLLGVRDMKDAARVASDANVALTGVHPLVIDGVTLGFGNRVMLPAQTTASESGLYEYTDAGAGNYALVRSSDADTSDKVTQGMSVDVVEGTTNGKTRWLLTTADPLVLDTTALTFINVPLPAAQIQYKKEVFNITAQNITDGYIDLANLIEGKSLMIYPVGGPPQTETVDYTYGTQGAITRVTFAGDLATRIAAGDDLICQYAHF